MVKDVVLKSGTFHSSSNSRVWKVKMKYLSTSKKLTDALQQKHSELPKHWNLLPSPPQQPTRRLIAERRQRRHEEKSRACASLSGSFPPQVRCRRQLSISRCNLQSESCCNYTPESSYTPERRRKWKVQVSAPQAEPLCEASTVAQAANYTWFIAATGVIIYCWGLMVWRHREGTLGFLEFVIIQNRTHLIIFTVGRWELLNYRQRSI